MKIGFKLVMSAVLLLTVAASFTSFLDQRPGSANISFPYKQAGLTERQAAAHLLSRFTYGSRPGEIDEVVKTGLEKWFQEQLKANIPDEKLNAMLAGYDGINLSNTEVVNTYPKGAQVLRMAMKDGKVDKDALSKTDKSEYKAALTAYMQQNGLKPQQELFRQFISQKILRATYSGNQVQEVLTDFWFNHFNVSITKNDCAEFIPAYERDVIRPNVFGKFGDLLLATAKSPAMLLYLDNFSSSGVNETTASPAIRAQALQRVMNQEKTKMDPAVAQCLQKVQKAKKAPGLNENYAREVMELHTLGVDGGYTQQDVTQAARVLTGWTIYPMGKNGYGSGVMQQLIDRAGEDNLTKRGFVHDGDFMFAANRHDTKEKTVLKRQFKEGGGYQEGVDLLNMLAHHPSTAQFISRKIAVRFVNDNPSKSLVEKMAKTFREKDGDIRQVLITTVSSPEFWSKDALREKTKSPFELAISAVRSLNADVKQPYQLFTWMDKMGQKIYYYQAPTGFPDRGQYWINTGSLLNRMNFGLALASQRIPGVKINLISLNNNHEPESAESALATYSRIIMPERDLNETLKRLSPMLHDPDLGQKVDQAADKTKVYQQPDMIKNEDALIIDANTEKISAQRGKNGASAQAQNVNSALSQVVGVIIGSPEFQRK